MFRSPGEYFLCFSLCTALASCTPRPAIADARREAAAAQALMIHAVELQKSGNEQAAASEGQRAQDGLYAARDRYLSAGADQSRDPEVLIEFAEFVEKLGDSDLSGEAYLRAAGLRPGDARLWYRAGRNFVDAGGRYVEHAAEPLDRAEAALRIKPGGATVAEIETARGDIRWKSGAYAIAAKKYAAALAADATSVRAQIGSAATSLALGDPARAEAAIQSIAESDAGPLTTRLREAYFAFRKDGARLPESAAAHRALAGLCVRAGILGGAQSAIEYALTLDDKDVYSWNMAGSLAEAAGDTEHARHAYVRSLELQPDQPRTKESLAGLPPANAGTASPK